MSKTVSWLPTLPSGWREISLQYLAVIETGSRDTVDAKDDGEFPFIIRSAHPLRIDTYSYDTEAILTAGDGAVGEIFHHISGKFEAHQRVYVIHSFRGVYGRFLYWYISSQFRQVVSYGGAQTTVASLRRSMLATLPVALPPLESQRRIADYLDRETSQIDAMIDKLGELEVTLNDRRVDAIKRAITSETSIAIGIMVDVTLGKMLQPSQKRLDDVQRPYLRAAHVQPGGVIDFEVDEKQMWFSDTEVQTLDLRAGDTVVVEGGAGFGRAAHLTEGLPGWGFQNSIIRLRGSESDCRYLMYSLHSALDSGAIHVACNAATFAHFTAEKVESFRVPFHEPAERARIADHLDDVTTKIDAMLSKVAELKDLLTERRAALITDVVTGRKEVA